MPYALRPVALLLLLTVCAVAQPEGNRAVVKDLASIRSIKFTQPLNVDIESTVTYVDPLWNFFFLQTGDDAIFAYGTPLPIEYVGKKVRAQGTLVAGDLQPVIRVKDCEVVGECRPLVAKAVNLGELDYGEMECRLVTASGIVRQIIIGAEDALVLCEAANSRSFLIRVLQQQGRFSNPQAMVGRRIECEGCLGLEIQVPAFSAPGGGTSKIEAFKVFCNSSDAVRLLDDAKPDRPVPSMLMCELETRVANGDRFLTHGQISLISSDETPPSMVVYDDSTSVRMNLGSTKKLLPGMVLRIYGTRSQDEDGNPVFTADLLQQLNLSALPRLAARRVDAAVEGFKPYERIAVKGRPGEFTIDDQGNATLMLVGNKSRVAVRILPGASESLAFIRQRVASKVRVTGVALPASPGSNAQMQLRVNRPEDLELIERRVAPPQAFLVSLVGMLSAIGLAILWIKMLRSQVAATTQTERMVSAQLRSSYEAIADGVLATDNENRVLAVNSEFCRICGQDIEIGDDVQKIHEAFAARSSDEETLSRFHPNSIASNDSKITFEMELDEKQKQSTYLTVQLAPITGEDGNQSLGSLLVVRDETKNRQLQAELMHSNKLDAIGRLVGGVAHDFNNILTAVTANITLARLEEDASVREVTKVLEVAEDAAFRGAEIIRRLLTYSLREKYSLEPHRINSIIERLRELIHHTFDATFEFDFDLNETNPVVMVEGTALEQVLLNLYVNAKDAMPDGGRIKTTTRVLRNPATDSDCVVVEVEDTGPGVPPEICDKIFEPYFTTKPKEHGTGLGLSVSYSVIQQHGGLLQHLDRPGGGSIFQITLPRHIDKVVIPSNGHSRLPKGNGTILVVDDEEIVRNGAVMMLSRQGFQTISASGGEEAIQRLEESQEPIDAVLLDLSMPGMSGREALRTMKQRWPEVPVVLCSGYLSDDLARLDGPDAVVPKPYSMKKLVTTMSEVTMSEGT